MEQQIIQQLAEFTATFKRVLESHNPTLAPTLGALVAEFVRSKERAGRSRGYTRRLPVTLKTFVRGREKRPLASVTSAEIEDWIAESKWAARTRRGYLLNLRTVFNYAVRRNYLARNPAAPVDLPAKPCAAPEIHTPAQVRLVMETAKRMDLNLMRALAVRYFAGVRACEVNRLAAADIRRDEIEVTAAKSKTRTRRLVKIQPNLSAWLALGGSLPVRNPDQRMAALTAALPFPWERNAARHSFVSYHLAAFGSAAATALDAGHTETILFNTYRRVVSAGEAREFWSILPETDQMELFAAV